MKYYELIVKSYGLMSKNISMMISDQEYEFDCFSTKKFTVNRPVKIIVNYYNGEPQVEQDFVSAGNPQIVSGDFKNLVERFSPLSAQFFETKNITYETKRKYYVMHVIKSISCLDRNKSKISDIQWRNPIVVGVVDNSKIKQNDHIFRLAENTAKHYVSEDFVKEFKKRKLTGCEFCLRS